MNNLFLAVRSASGQGPLESKIRHQTESKCSVQKRCDRVARRQGNPKTITCPCGTKLKCRRSYGRGNIIAKHLPRRILQPDTAESQRIQLNAVEENLNRIGIGRHAGPGRISKTEMISLSRYGRDDLRHTAIGRAVQLYMLSADKRGTYDVILNLYTGTEASAPTRNIGKNLKCPCWDIRTFKTPVDN